VGSIVHVMTVWACRITVAMMIHDGRRGDVGAASRLLFMVALKEWREVEKGERKVCIFERRTTVNSKY
jgi:hypothetical protein